MHLGVDFGTALTKVAVRVADFVFFIPWDELIGDAGYLLPGRLSSTENGARVPGAGKCQTLKEPFLPGNLADEDDHVRAVEFLAGVIRFSRAWLYNNQPNLVRNYRLAWNLRIGCPTNLFEADDSKDVYKRLAIVAWVASQSARLLTAEDVRRMLRARVVETDTGLDELEAVPEFVAQITSYSHSPQRVDGLHLLVDCGAGTVDVVSFNVFRHPNSLEDRSIWPSDRFWFGAPSVRLVLRMTGPSECVVIVEFDVERQGILVSQILYAQGVYIQPGRPDDRLATTLNKPRVLVEVPRNREFRHRWERLFAKANFKRLRKKGLSRAEAKYAVKTATARWQEVFHRRMGFGRSKTGPNDEKEK